MISGGIGFFGIISRFCSCAFKHVYILPRFGMRGIIYEARCKRTGQKYVGCTTNALIIRKRAHYGEARRVQKRLCDHFQSKWLQALISDLPECDGFAWSVLDTVDVTDRGQLKGVEGAWINHLGTVERGLNSNSSWMFGSIPTQLSCSDVVDRKGLGLLKPCMDESTSVTPNGVSCLTAFPAQFRERKDPTDKSPSDSLSFFDMDDTPRPTPKPLPKPKLLSFYDVD